MPNPAKKKFLAGVRARVGPLRKLEKSQSLYELEEGSGRILIRYSRVHSRNQTFYGLRDEDLSKLEEVPSLICFLWNDQPEPLLVPFAAFEEVFRSTKSASDGQYKSQIYLEGDNNVTELYIAQAGRFNVEAYFGWGQLSVIAGDRTQSPVPELTHSEVQTILGAIGVAKEYDVWIPRNDRTKLGWDCVERFQIRSELPATYQAVMSILQEVDVVWAQKGSNILTAMFEIEHSTPIYSGLLRFNDIHLVAPHDLGPRFTVVAGNERRGLFVNQLNRPTFQASGLHKLCNFMDYSNVYHWFNRIAHESVK